MKETMKLNFSKIRARVGGQLIFDLAAWFVSITLSAVSRYDFNLNVVDYVPLLGLALAAAILQTIFGNVLHLYRGRFKIATFDELKALLLTTAAVAVPLAVIVLVIGPFWGIPRSTMVLSAPIFLVLSGSMRVARRIFRANSKVPGENQRTLIYGAGSMAEALIPQLLQDPKSQYLPIGLLDDSEQKANRWINGVPMLGSWLEFPSIVRSTGAEIVIVCIARADATFMKKVEQDCRKAGVKVIVLPTLDEVLQGHTGIGDLRALSIEDLVGRRPIDTEVEQITSYLQGKKVLVTGAGGSIGSELCRQISRFGPSKLIMLDRDETGLQLAQLGVSGHGLLDTKDIILADIREAEVLNELFERETPEVVFHAAALKHLPVLEQFPDEAWKTNVLGTKNVLEAAQAVGVKTFINISTDKAADPTSILGKSKKLAEGLTSWFADISGDKYLSVRFGNVLGSRGSMLPTFTALIESGGPLTVTHPDVTRFFMTIPEACQLVLQAGAIGRPQDVLILDMGEPVKILDIANRMIEISGKKIEIVFTGLRPGEKLHEDLYGTKEDSEVLVHKLISHATVDPLDPQNLTRSLLK